MIKKKAMTSMSVQCHYTYNSELHHLRMGDVNVQSVTF